MEVQFRPSHSVEAVFNADGTIEVTGASDCSELRGKVFVDIASMDQLVIWWRIYESLCGPVEIRWEAEGE